MNEQQKHATKAEISAMVIRLKTAFPRHSNEFFALLAERMVAGGFAPDELEGAVNHVIDTCEFLTIANVINAANERKAPEYDIYRAERPHTAQ
jgi:hypothetical protein